MAITFTRLFEQVVTFDNLWRAYEKVRRGKRYKPAAAAFDMHAERHVLELKQELETDAWRPGACRHFRIFEPKLRVISAAPFRDRVVHHAVVNVLEPIYEARFSGASYACRRGKGTHAAMERAHWGVRNCRCFLKGDIVKFYPTVDHAVLREVLSRRIADGRLLALLDRIIAAGADIPGAEAPRQWFEGDDLLSPLDRARGLPIGNLTSQFFANVLLDQLDQCVHTHIKPREYVRYADDFLLFDNDADRLQEARGRVGACLDGLRLRAHPTKTCVRACRQGVRFLGFRLLPLTRRIDRRSITRFRRRMRRYLRMGSERRVSYARITASVRGWLAHASHANTRAMVREVLNDVRC